MTQPLSNPAVSGGCDSKNTQVPKTLRRNFSNQNSCGPEKGWASAVFTSFCPPTIWLQMWVQSWEKGSKTEQRNKAPGSRFLVNSKEDKLNNNKDNIEK